MQIDRARATRPVWVALGGPAAIEALAARVRAQEDRATYLRTVSASHRVAKQASVRTRRRGELADRLLVLAEGQWSPHAQSARGAATRSLGPVSAQLDGAQ